MPIKIIAKKDGFRRAGLAHVGTVIYPDDHFTKEQLKALKAEPCLDVSHTDEKPPETEDSGKTKGGKK